jgi:phospholipid/cholesterol/gamma-HCH transport system substrate-binding protein
LTVIFAALTLALLIFLMTGSSGLFTKKITLFAYFDNAGGLRVGAPVRLHGVDVGNVKSIRVVPDRKQTPVQVTMKLNTRYNFDLRQDSLVSLSTAGVLGETFIDIDSSQAKGPGIQEGATLETREKPGLDDVMRATQSTLQNVQALLGRADRIVGFIESGQGSIGKLIFDDTLYKRLNASVSEVQGIIATINSGEGSIGKLIASDDLYNKANASIDKLNNIIDQVNAGEGTVGKFFKDPALYNNANQTIAKANQLMTDINSGKGAIGKLAKDEAFARKLDDTITKLNTLADKLNNGPGTASRIMNDPALYNNADKMLLETRALIQAIRENPKKYLTIHFRIF